MLTEALFTTAEIWKQPKCPSVGEQLKKMWHKYRMEYSHKKELNSTICNNKGDPEDIIIH